MIDKNDDTNMDVEASSETDPSSDVDSRSEVDPSSEADVSSEVDPSSEAEASSEASANNENDASIENNKVDTVEKNSDDDVSSNNQQTESSDSKQDEQSSSQEPKAAELQSSGIPVYSAPVTKSQNNLAKIKDKLSPKIIAIIAGGVLACIAIACVSFAVINHQFVNVSQDAILGTISFKYPDNWQVTTQKDDNLVIQSDDESCKIEAKVVNVWDNKKVPIDKENAKSVLSSYATSNANSSESQDVTYNDCEGTITESKGSTDSKAYVYTARIYDGYQLDKLELTFPNNSYESVVDKIFDSISVEKHTHKEGTWNTEKQASCSQTGEMVAECVGSDHKLAKTINKTEHTPGDWEVLKDYTISSEGTVTPGTEVRKCTVCGAQVDSRKYTTSLSSAQLNALKKASSYLSFSGFSHDGLVEQLEYEKFSHDDSVFAADHCGADWNYQAERKAQSYLKFTSFSRDGLIDQLMYEGFTYEQAEYGVNKVGL